MSKEETPIYQFNQKYSLLKSLRLVNESLSKAPTRLKNNRFRSKELKILAIVLLTVVVTCYFVLKALAAATAYNSGILLSSSSTSGIQSPFLQINFWLNILSEDWIIIILYFLAVSLFSDRLIRLFTRVIVKLLFSAFLIILGIFVVIASFIFHIKFLIKNGRWGEPALNSIEFYKEHFTITSPNSKTKDVKLSEISKVDKYTDGFQLSKKIGQKDKVFATLYVYNKQQSDFMNKYFENLIK